MSNPRPNPINKRFKQLLEAIKERTGHNRSEIAANLDVDRSTLTHLCTGRSAAPSAKTARLLRDVYGAAGWIMSGKGEMFEEGRPAFQNPRGALAGISPDVFARASRVDPERMAQRIDQLEERLNATTSTLQMLHDLVKMIRERQERDGQQLDRLLEILEATDKGKK